MCLCLVFLCGTAQAWPLRVVGYYPAWVRPSFPPEAVDFGCLTHVAHAFAWPTGDGSIATCSDFDASGFVAAVHAAGKRAILALGGWGQSDNFAPMAADPARRARFTTAVKDLCLSAGYDGVDIDGEYPSAADRGNLTAWVTELRQALHTLGWPTSLSMAVPAGAWSGSRYDFVGLSSLDWIGCMTYDFHGSWTAHAGHNAPLYSSAADPCGSVHDAVLYLLSQGVPRQKLLVGIPLYGRLFNATRLYGSSTGGTEVWYSQVVTSYLSTWAFHWDEVAKVPYLTSPSGTRLLSFDDTASVGLKYAYVRSQQLGGAIVWALGQDVVEGQQVLMRVVGRALLASTAVQTGPPSPTKAELYCFPHPCTTWLKVSCRMAGAQAVTLRLYDACGRTVREAAWSSAQEEGWATFDVAGLSSGLYVLRALAGTGGVSGKVLIVRSPGL